MFGKKTRSAVSDDCKEHWWKKTQKSDKCSFQKNAEKYIQFHKWTVEDKVLQAIRTASTDMERVSAISKSSLLPLDKINLLIAAFIDRLGTITLFGVFEEVKMNAVEQLSLLKEIFKVDSGLFEIVKSLPKTVREDIRSILTNIQTEITKFNNKSNLNEFNNLVQSPIKTPSGFESNLRKFKNRPQLPSETPPEPPPARSETTTEPPPEPPPGRSETTSEPPPEPPPGRSATTSEPPPEPPPLDDTSESSESEQLDPKTTVFSTKRSVQSKIHHIRNILFEVELETFSLITKLSPKLLLSDYKVKLQLCFKPDSKLQKTIQILHEMMKLINEMLYANNPPIYQEHQELIQNIIKKDMMDYEKIENEFKAYKASGKKTTFLKSLLPYIPLIDLEDKLITMFPEFNQFNAFASLLKENASMFQDHYCEHMIFSLITNFLQKKAVAPIVKGSNLSYLQKQIITKLNNMLSS